MNNINWSEWVEDDNHCIDCGNYSPDSSWCDECLDTDIEEYEERKRERLAEQQEY